MAKLVFRVQSDWEEVVKLRNEIAKLKQELKSMDSTQSPAAFKALNTQLFASTQRMDELVNEAAKAGAVMKSDFKKKIFDASQAVNGFTEKIISQKAVVKDIEADVRRLGDAYRIALKRNPLSASGKLEEYNAARRALDEEKAALFGLTQQQAEARLSVKKLRDEYALFKDDSKDNVDAISAIKDEIADIGGKIFAGWSIEEFVGKMVQVRGEFQAADTAIQTLLGSKEKADALMSQVREYAKISPLEFSDVTAATQMMLGFNIEAEKVPKFISAIGDVSMGESGKFNSLTLAFSQMSAAGKLMGQDLNQMINAGFNPLQMMSEKTGKSIATLKDEMSKGAISAEMVQQAFIDATSAGGKFYNMSENASKTINGQLSMMQDAMDAAFNEMGQKSEGVIMKGIQMTTSLIGNYETVGKVLAGLIATYGAYRTAVMLVTAAESKHTLVEIGLTNARILARKAQLALNAAMLTNPYVLLATVVVGVTAAIWAMSDSASAAEKEADRLKKRTDEQTESIDKEKEHIESLISVLEDETKTKTKKNEAFKELKSLYSNIFSKYKTEKDLIDNITEARKAENLEIERKKNLLNVQNVKDDANRYKELQELLKLERIGGAGRTRQGKEAIYSSLYSKYGLANKSFFQSNESYIQDLLKSTKQSVGAGQQKVREQELSAWEERVQAYDKEAAKGHLKMLEGYKKLLKKSRKQWIQMQNEESPINAEMLQGRIDYITQNVINVEEGNAAKYRSEAKKAWEDAKKEVENIKTGNKKYKNEGEYEKALKEAQDKADAAEKTYKNRGGVTGSSLKNQQKDADTKLKQEEKLSEELLSIRRKNQQDEINLMADGTEKKLAQIDLDYQKELDAIEKQREEWNKAQKGKLTDEQETQLSASEENAYKKYEKNVKGTNKEKLDADRKAWQEYFIAFGDYQEKRKAITQKYEDEIAKIKENGGSEGNIKTAEANQAKELSALDEQYGKSPKAMADLFEDASDKSVNAIQAIIDKYELLVSYLSGGNGVTVEDLKAVGFTDKDLESIENGTVNIKDVTDAIKTLKGTLGGKSPFKKFTEDIKSGIDELKNAKGDTDKIGIGLSKIGKAASEFTDPLKEFSSNIGNIFGFDDSKVQGAIDAVGGLGQTAAGVGQIMSGDIVGGAMSAVQGISQVVSAFDGMFGADYSHYNAMKEQYDTLNSIWDELIDKKKEYINTSYGAEANKVGKEALELAEKSIESYRILGKERLNSGASAGSHSIGVRIRKGMSAEGWAQAREALGADFDKATSERMAGLFDLSVEQVEKLKEADIFWSKLDDDVREYLQGIIDGEERIKDIQNQIKEQLTQVSFDSVFDSFVDMLMNMDSSAEDFSKNFEQYMQRAILTTMVGDKYKAKLQAWYDSFAKANDDKSGITKDEMEKSQAEWDAIVAEALAERNALKDTMGWTGDGTTQQGGSTRGFQTMSQDTGEELNGRFTALQIAGEEIKNQNVIQSQSLNLLTAKVDAILSTDTEVKNIADDTRDLIAQSYIELMQISENTGNSAKHLKDIKADIAEMKNKMSNL